MTDDTMLFLGTLLKRGGGEFMKELAEEVLERLMAYDVEGQIGAGRYERDPSGDRRPFARDPNNRHTNGLHQATRRLNVRSGHERIQ